MAGYRKIKYIFFLITVCLLGGCNTIAQDTDDSVMKSDNINVTESPEPTGVKHLSEEPDKIEAKLKDAISNIKDKKYPKAIGLLSGIKDNEQAKYLLEQLHYIISGTYLANLNAGIAAIDNSGKVNVIIDDSLNKYYGYDQVSNWDNIKSLSYAQGRLDALDKEGVIRSTKDTDPSYTYVADQLKSYTDLSAISTDYDNYVLLSKKGNIYTYSAKYSDVLDLFKDDNSTWKDVVDVITGQLRIAALKTDGTVYVADYNKILNPANDYLYIDIDSWTDIVAISADTVGSIAGLKSDGTVVISTSNMKGTSSGDAYNVSGWDDIIAISKSNNTLMGLKRDGTVVATGNNEHQQLEVSGWSDIVAIAAGDWISIGLKSDGTLVIAGETEEGVATPDVSGVNHLYVPSIKY